jgi:hypothetical protein
MQVCVLERRVIDFDSSLLIDQEPFIPDNGRLRADDDWDKLFEQGLRHAEYPLMLDW